MSKEGAKVIEERLLTVPLRGAYYGTRWRRAEKAARLLKEHVARHMKASEVKISTEVNEALWAKGAEKPPRRIKVRVAKDEEGVAWVYLQSLPDEEVGHAR
ncbi:MAG: 50S ribosomal protein L31e [Candidatus Nezhaarchaeota archaeon]|nr:50S ribosomal protein L31e [Candidatus Nezhaarchaeota archaeon]